MDPQAAPACTPEDAVNRAINVPLAVAITGTPRSLTDILPSRSETLTQVDTSVRSDSQADSASSILVTRSTTKRLAGRALLVA
jgi:hypothetical protein